MVLKSQVHISFALAIKIRAGTSRAAYVDEPMEKTILGKPMPAGSRNVSV